MIALMGIFVGAIVGLIVGAIGGGYIAIDRASSTGLIVSIV